MNISDFLDQNPLMRLSSYSHTQSAFLCDLGAEINDLLDLCVQSTSDSQTAIDSQKFNRAHFLFWLWVLGAFEVCRTMYKHRRHLSPEFATRVKRVKRELSLVRTPFAKQELSQPRGQTVFGELSVVGFCSESRDLVYEIEGKHVYPRALIKGFEDFISSATPQDIRADLSSE